MLRREAACDTSRSGIASSAVTRPAEHLRIARQVLAHRANDRHLPLAPTSAKPLQVLDDRVEPPRVVHRHRHADLRRGHHVDRRLEPLEHLEEPPQEAVRHQHARRRDVDDRDVPLAGDRGQARRRSAAIGGDAASRDCRAAASSGSAPGCSSTPPAGWCSGAAPWRRSTPAPRLRQTTAAARRAAPARPRIGRQHAVDVGPDLNLVDVEAGAEDGGRIVRPAAAERRGDAVGSRADEAAEHRHLAALGHRRDGALARGRRSPPCRAPRRCAPHR